MKVDRNGIVFENQRDRDIFYELLHEVNVSELRPEIAMESIRMLEKIQKGVIG